MSSGSFKNNVTCKLYAYKSYIYIKNSFKKDFLIFLEKPLKIF